MAIGLILLSLVALCLGVFGWLWLAGGALRDGWRGLAGAVALQISGLCLLWGLLAGQPLKGLYQAMFPPLAVVDLASLSGMRGFLALLLWQAAPYGLAALALALAWKPLRRWAPGIALSALMVAGLVLGEGSSRGLLCDSAAARGLRDVRAAGLSQSLALRGETILRPLHGLAMATDGARWGWSYGLMDWFPLPETLTFTGGLEALDCAASG